MSLDFKQVKADFIGKNRSEGCKLEFSLFSSFDIENRGYVRTNDIIGTLKVHGLLPDDPRLSEIMGKLKNIKNPERITQEEFQEVFSHSNILVSKALTGEIALPDFQSFCDDVDKIYDKTADIKSGRLADYIPQLARVNPDYYGVTICTNDGQRYSKGNSDIPFCLQSSCKPINYCVALEEYDDEYVHRYIGHEPSGRSFNELALNHNGIPHNPMINAGAIMCSSLIKPELNIADRFDFLLGKWKSLAGNQAVGFNNAVYLSEKQTADRNFALGYFMRERNAFPKGTQLIEVLEFYFQCCSIELTTESMAVAAGTLANGGICPLTGERIFSESTVKNCLSLMYSCGMYDYSGEFAFKIGLPAKSGVSGVIMVVVPNVLGLCVWAPPLDRHGNSVRGVEFIRQLVDIYNFHNYDSMILGASEKKNPRLHLDESRILGTEAICWAAYNGDLSQLRQLDARGVDLEMSDYDGRTALHVAASEGHEHIVKYLLQRISKTTPKDRWGNSPIDSALRGNHKNVAELLRAKGTKAPSSLTSDRLGKQASSDKTLATEIPMANKPNENLKERPDIRQ